MEQETSIRDLFNGARDIRQQLDSAPDSLDPTYQRTLHAAIAQLEECRQLIDRHTLFSPNETIEDVPSGDLPCAMPCYVKLILSLTRP